MERIQKLIAQSGLCSRRAAEELLAAGRVTVNGAVAQLGDKAAPTDTVCVDGKPLTVVEQKTYLMLHKPRGYTCTLKDKFAEHLVTELVADCGARVFPVGRLDKDSEGLLLMSDDGAFMQTMTHPRHGVEKVYEVTVHGALEGCEERLAAIRDLNGEPIRPAKVRKLAKNVLEVTISQGKNRQVRRMCAQVGLTVERLKRVKEHTLTLGDLPCGAWRYLTDDEIRSLQANG